MSGNRPAVVVEMSSGRAALEELPPSLSTAQLSHLRPRRGHCLQRDDNGGCVGDGWGRVGGFHFHSLHLHEARVGTNERCWSLCSCSAALTGPVYRPGTSFCPHMQESLLPLRNERRHAGSRHISVIHKTHCVTFEANVHS